MATPPTLSAYQQSTWSDAVSTSEVTASISWSAGDLIVVVGATEDNADTLGVPTATGLTFSQLVATNTGSNCKTYVWTATAAGSGSGAITSTVDGTTKARGLSAFAYSGSDGTGATNTLVSSTAKVISLTRGTDNAAVLVVLGDWAAVNDVAVNSSPGGGTQRVAQHVSGRATFFVFDWGDQGAAGTTSYGITDHTGTVTMAGIVVEIKGTAAAGGDHPAVKRMGGVRFAHSLGQGRW